MPVSLKDLTVLLWKECLSHQTAQAAESRFFQLAINVPRTAKMRRQCGDTLYTIKFKHWGSWSIWGIGNLQGWQVRPCLHKSITLAEKRKKKKNTEKRSIFGFSSDPFSSIHRCLQFVKRGGKNVERDSYMIFSLSLRTVSSRKLPMQTHYRTIEPDN